MDRFVADRTGLSRSYVQKLIAEGAWSTTTGRRLRANSEVRGGARDPRGPARRRSRTTWSPTRRSRSTVVYEDDDLLIVDKPAGLVVHPAPGPLARARSSTRCSPAATTTAGIAGVARPGIVHRLDRDTSGLLIVARNDAAQASLQAQLKARRVRKTYLALVQGSVAARVGPDRGAHRARPQGPQADGRRARRPAGRHGLPRPRAVRATGRCSSWTSSPAGPTRSASTSRPSATPSRATRCTAPGRRARARTAWSACSSTPGGWSSCRRRRPSWSGSRRRCPAALEAVLEGLRGGRGVGRPAAGREGRRDGAGGAARGRARGAAGDHQRAVRAWARTRSSTRCAARPREPDYHYVVTCTTRGPRPGEVPGVSYQFLTPEAVPRAARARASCSRPTRSTATGTARRGARWRRRSPRATT